MAANNRATLKAMQTLLKAMGTVKDAVIGEPKSKVQSGLVAILPESGNIRLVTLGNARNSPHEVHAVTLRRFENAMQGPEEDIEFKLDAWRADIVDDILGDFTLGGEIAYALPAEFSWQYGFVTVENTIFRFLDLNVAYEYHRAEV